MTTIKRGRRPNGTFASEQAARDAAGRDGWQTFFTYSTELGFGWGAFDSQAYLDLMTHGEVDAFAGPGTGIRAQLGKRYYGGLPGSLSLSVIGSVGRVSKRLPCFFSSRSSARRDGMTWRRVHEPDGSVTYEGHCPSPLRVFLQVRGLTKPYEVKCVCGGWHKLP